MGLEEKIKQAEQHSGRSRPIFLVVTSAALVLAALAVIVLGIVNQIPAGLLADSAVQTWAALIFVSGSALTTAWGLWNRKDWARITLVMLLILGLAFIFVQEVFRVFSIIFAGERVVRIQEIGSTLLGSLLNMIKLCALPVLFLFGLLTYGSEFAVSASQREFVDRIVRYLLFAIAMSAIIIVFMIIMFTMMESWQSIEEIGLENMLMGTIWRPGSIIGTVGQYGLLPMIAGSILSTIGAVVLGVPLSLGTAILLAEVAPHAVREIVRPAIELLAGIPSVVYGLFGMVVLAPLIREIDVPGNSGFGLLNASIVLAVMVIPTVTNIAEDAIRAVPRSYKEGSLALGTTHWQTIWTVILPAARSGIIAAVILGVGRALGETMAMIMVIGNSIAFPEPLTNNPLTMFLDTARTLTGNIAVEINYAAGAHRSALFFTGLLLFLMILFVNSMARYLMRERQS
ncbi:MAG: phosphate ABC transporter permease subunit PstC [Anaerolineales bacterium]|nr:phosphate ABC transporter permease subunit PstC [Anaerolineales bacterium]